MNKMTIWKYKLTHIGLQTIRMPSPQVFRALQYQGDNLCMWYEVNAHPSSDDFEEIDFLIVGTGHTVPQAAQYLGTVQHGEFVWHVYARGGHEK